jgi:hypothetical protein
MKTTPSKSNFPSRRTPSRSSHFSSTPPDTPTGQAAQSVPEPASRGPESDALLEVLQRETFEYFQRETNPENGLVKDKTCEGAPASIAAVGLALGVLPVGVERGFCKRARAVRHVLTALRFFWNSPQSQAPDATGYKGFYYHFLDMQTGRRAWKSELSSIDTTLLLAGALLAAQYFDADNADERELRELAEALYRRADWQWMRDGDEAVSLSWKPERGFQRYRWTGYNEALLLYALALGSPTFPIPPESYAAWTSTYKWKKIYGHEFLYAGPLFIHQLSHAWIDFRGLQDEYMRGKGIDYFENSRRATYVQREYAIRNPKGFDAYSECCWGISASDGPGPMVRKINGRTRRFYNYRARGVPYGPDDGSLAPWAAVSSLPFAPEIVLPAIQFFEQLELREHEYGFRSTFNATYPTQSGNKHGWVSPYFYAIDQGPIVLMIENYRTGLPWRLMRGCKFLEAGLRRAGFEGGWLS